MISRPSRLAAASAVVLVLAACSSETTPEGAPPATSTSTSAPTTRPAPPMPDVGAVPLEHDAGYADAVATFGADQVEAAATADAQIAHIALADCLRWRTGTVDPRLSELVAPELLTRVTDELALPEGTVTSLLSHLPSDDGNGNDEAAAVVDGCDDSAPLRYGPQPVTVVVDRSGSSPRLVLTGSYVVDLAFGELRVQAGQDWVFTSEQTHAGWRLTDVAAAAHVNWAPPRVG